MVCVVCLSVFLLLFVKYPINYVCNNYYTRTNTQWLLMNTKKLNHGMGNFKLVCVVHWKNETYNSIWSVSQAARKYNEPVICDVMPGSDWRFHSVICVCYYNCRLVSHRTEHYLDPFYSKYSLRSQHGKVITCPLASGMTLFHSVKSPSMVDPQWNIWYWGSRYNLYTVGWGAVLCEWGTTSVYLMITYVCVIPSRLPVFAVEPQYRHQDSFLSKVSFEGHIQNLQKISCWFKI